MTEDDARALLEALDSEDWGAAREAVEQVSDLLRTQQVDDPMRADLASRLLRLSSHPKWEVRKAVAHAVLFLRHDAFHAVLARIVDDDNAWVREAARKTLHRRDGLSRGDIHGQVHGDAIDGMLTALETRHGARVRRAAMNVADHLHHRFVREAYHEIIRRPPTPVSCCRALPSKPTTSSAACAPGRSGAGASRDECLARLQ